jgi:hypothetical protein
MTSKRRRGRVYWRDRAGTRRAYADFRDYADVGGKLEPLIAPGERFATTDSDVAAKLGRDRFAELEAAHRRRALYGHAYRATLAAQAADYLVAARRRAGSRRHG